MPCSLCKASSHTDQEHECAVCKGFGHRGRDCRSSPRPSSAAKSTAKCSLCNATSHTDQEHECAVCKGLGHRGRDCRASSSSSSPRKGATKCSLCGDDDHTDQEHECAVCKGHGHRGRDCTEVETEGLPGRTATLFHMTDETAADAIIKSETMRPGSKGMFGAGIYGCMRKEDCLGKAHNTGVTLRLEVKLGRSLVCRKARPELTLAAVRKFDCSSVKGLGGTAVTRDEYAVFESWQVTRISVDSYQKAGAPVAPSAWPAWVLAIESMAAAYVPPPPPASEPVRSPSAKSATATASTPASAKNGVPIAKSTGLPDKRYKGANLTPPVTPSSVPIAKSTGLPDRRYRGASETPPAAPQFVPIAKSTGLPDRRYGPRAAAASPFMDLAGGMFPPGFGLGNGGGGGGGYGGYCGGPLCKDGSPDMRFAVNKGCNKY